MLVLYIFTLMFTISINHLKKNIHSTFINRISVLTILISILLTLNVLNFQSIGKGITIYSGLFQITIQSQIIELLLLVVGLCILTGWPSFTSLNNTLATNKSDLSVTPKAKGLAPYFTQLQLFEAKEQYSLIAIFSIIGGSLLMSSLDLLSMFLSIELQSFALYILATLNKDNLTSTSAGLKYFLLGSLSSCFILLGSAIIYSYTGLTQFEAISSLISVTTEIKDNTMDTYLPLAAFSSSFTHDINKAFTIGLVIIIIGFLFKISAAPFYQWAPDVYDGSPTIVTVWLTLIVKLTILTFLLSLFEFTLYGGITATDNNQPLVLEMIETSVHAVQQNLLLISSLLSLIIGTVVGLSQIKVKRLLAYSSITHVGFLLLALSIYTQKSIDSFLFYLVQYSITNLNIFLILLAFAYLQQLHSTKNGVVPSVPYIASSTLPFKTNSALPAVHSSTGSTHDINYLVELKGELYKNPILSISLAVCLFSMAGIPPLIGFFSKQFVLFSSIENGNYFLSVVAILISVISASYYLKLIKLTFFESALPAEETQPLLTTLLHSNYFVDAHLLSKIHSYIISILSCIILFFFLYPNIILNGTQLISLTIFNI